MSSISNVVIETKRLVLRAWRESDLDDFFEYASIEGVGEMAGWPHHESKEVTKAILESFMNDDVFAIVYKENNKVIGSIGLKESWANSDKNYNNLKCKDVGYVLSKDYWGKGLMPEALDATIIYCFEELNLEVLTCNHFTFNSQSQKVIKKCGFEYVKSDVFHSPLLAKSFDTMQYILTPNMINI